jgi:hypothetical protein
MMTDFVEIIDNFLEKSYFNYIVNEVIGDSIFPWYYAEDSSSCGNNVYTMNGKSISNAYGFSTKLVNEEGPLNYLGDRVYPFALKVKDLLRANNVLRVRADMCMYDPSEKVHAPHVDFPGQHHYSSILYLNETDGDTFIFNEKDPGVQINKSAMRNFTIKETISPKPNRLLIFDGSYVHTGSSPSRHKSRKLLNSNYSL